MNTTVNSQDSTRKWPPNENQPVRLSVRRFIRMRKTGTRRQRETAPSKREIKREVVGFQTGSAGGADGTKTAAPYETGRPERGGDTGLRLRQDSDTRQRKSSPQTSNRGKTDGQRSPRRRHPGRVARGTATKGNGSEGLVEKRHLRQITEKKTQKKKGTTTGDRKGSFAEKSAPECETRDKSQAREARNGTKCSHPALMYPAPSSRENVWNIHEGTKKSRP